MTAQAINGGAKALEQYICPVKIKLINKPMKRQILEMNGMLGFNKGLYHNQFYENLIKNLITSRKAYRDTNDMNTRKNIAHDEIKNWQNYVEIRKKDLPEDFKITDSAKTRFKQIWDLIKDRKTGTIPGSKILDFHSEYSKVFKFDIPIDPKNLMRMIHPHYGYLSFFPLPFTLENLFEIYENKIISGFEEYNGQDILASEISAYTYWAYFDKELKGYMTVAEFVEFMKIFRINVTYKDFKKQFNFYLAESQGEIDHDAGENDTIIRFDFMRHVFLERNL